MRQYHVISGCSGGGKSTLIKALESKGLAAVPEAGRRIVKSESGVAGSALPWTDRRLFLEKAIILALNDYEKHIDFSGPLFFDRSLVDLILAYSHATGLKTYDHMLTEKRYGRRVFLTPPWPEIYVTDPERRHGFEDAKDEYLRLRQGYAALRYEVIIVPKADVETRADFISQYL